MAEALLVNGIAGIVRNNLHITDKESRDLEILPVCVLVEFRSYLVPTLYDGVVAIASVSVRLKKWHGL